MKDSSYSLYEPREDSFLLAKFSQTCSFGRVLDMGCGSGIQGISALKNDLTEQVVFADKNPKALNYAKSELTKIDHRPDIKTSFIKTDLFSSIKGRTFDTIIFNPPYLPDHPEIKDITCDGGPKGHELTVRFIQEAPDFLSQDGMILLLYSSFTGENKIIDAIEDRLMEYKLLGHMKLDHEELFVVQILKSNIAKELSKKGYKDIKIYAKGKRGLIIRSGKYCIKTTHPGSKAIGRIENEINILKRVNPIGPKLICYDKNYPYFVMEYLQGLPIEDYFQKSTYNQNIKIILKILKQLRKLDLMKINKLEMTNPHKHIIVRGTEPVLLDFERAKITLKPKNITQFMDYLYSRREIIKIPFDQNTMKILTIHYKNNNNETNYERILEYLHISHFQHEVYAELIKVPKGQVTTYGLLAKRLGLNSSRAIGTAMRKNPLAPEVPCHRVVKSDGTLGFYSGKGGPYKKLKMLQEEGIRFQVSKDTVHSKIIEFDRFCYT